MLAWAALRRRHLGSAAFLANRVTGLLLIGYLYLHLGVLYLQGRGVPKDPAEAASWFRRAADNGDLAGEVEFAILLFNGTGVPKDERAAARYFLHAAKRGNAIAQNRVARLYASGRGLPKNLVEAAAWNLAAAGQGLSQPGQLLIQRIVGFHIIQLTT